MVTIVGWENACAESETDRPSTRGARRIYMELDRCTAPWGFAEGAPDESISALELLSSTVGPMSFVPEGTAKWEWRFVATDSQVASKAAEQFTSTKFPLHIIAMGASHIGKGPKGPQLPS